MNNDCPITEMLQDIWLWMTSLPTEFGWPLGRLAKANHLLRISESFLSSPHKYTSIPCRANARHVKVPIYMATFCHQNGLSLSVCLCMFMDVHMYVHFPNPIAYVKQYRHILSYRIRQCLCVQSINMFSTVFDNNVFISMCIHSHIVSSCIDIFYHTILLHYVYLCVYLYIICLFGFVQVCTLL